MKSNFFHIFSNQLSAFSNQHFKKIAWATLIVYFITSLCGYINFLISHLYHKVYFPRRSYLIFFNKKDLSNFNLQENNVFNLSGFKTIINTTIPYKLIDDVFFLVVATLLVILFYLGYLAIKSNKISQLEIIKWSVLFSIFMAIGIPSQSSDLYGYIARGAQQTLYHQNPYLETVNKIKNYDTKPLLFNFEWPERPTTYGPVFIYLTKLVVLLSNNNFLLSFINFKLLNLTIFLFIVLLLLKNSDTKNLYLIAWNPLLLIHGLWNGHNDLISAALIFLGVYLLSRENHFWSSFCLIVSAGVKYISLLIIPVVIFYLIKNKSQKTIFLNFILGICSGLILITIFGVDYILPSDIQSLSNLQKIINNLNDVHGSLIATLLAVIKYICIWLKINCDFQTTQLTLKSIVYFLFGVFYILILSKKKSNLVFDIGLVLFVFFAFTIAKFQSWYLINVIILIPFLEDNLLKKILVFLSLSHVYALTFIYQAKILNFSFMMLLPIMLVLLSKFFSCLIQSKPKSIN